MYRYLSIGTLELSMYTLINMLAYLVAIVYNLTTYKQKGQLLSKFSHSRINQNKSSIKKCIIMESILISILQVEIGGLFSGLLAKITPGVVANYFGNVLISPFPLVLILILMGINPLRQLDLITPAYAIFLFISKIACFMHGCCEGIPTEFGLYFPYNEQYEFPSQLLEAFVALIIFIVLLCVARRSNRTPGLMFPLYLIMYSATRFFTEFTRANEPIIWKLQPYHLFCLIGIVLGILELLILALCGAKLDTFFEKRFEKFKK